MYSYRHARYAIHKMQNYWLLLQWLFHKQLRKQQATWKVNGRRKLFKQRRWAKRFFPYRL